jgi:hypothetical protein
MDDTRVNRRKMLRSLGLATLTAAAVPASSAAKPHVQELKRTYHTYGTIADMTRDSTLAEGVFLRVMGYHAAGDGGGAEYVVRKDKPANTEGTMPLANSLYAELINVARVNYRMFGTVSDQKNDDGVQIKSAHIYANRTNVPVINRTGEFWIKGTDAIPVLTSVEWGDTIFHIDENAGARANLFVVQSREAPVRIEFDAATKARVIAQVKPGVTIIPELAPYRNSFVLMTDTNDRIGSRGGARYGGTATRPKEEFFFVEEHGRILGDIAWEFTDYTSLVAHPGNSSYLIIDGGTFYMSGDAPRTSGYVNVGFSIRRSRTVIRNQWVGLEKGRADVSMSPKSGFYSFSSVYDVLLENVRLIPWEKDREGTDQDVPEGTYGIGGNRVLNGTFRNVTAEGSPIHWGVFGTNLFKNFRVEQCTLNRIDVHFHAWNLYIRDCRIGSNGITITGGGDLFVENTTCIASSFIAFRRDYGAKWDGDIRISNCRHAPRTTGETGILTFQADDFDYRYPIGYGRTVKVDGMVVDFRTVPASTRPAWLMRTSAFSMIKEGARVFFPEHLEFRNIVVQGRDQGMRLLQIPDPQRFKLSRAGGYDGIQLTANCRMIFEDVQTERIPAAEPRSDQVHLLVKSAANLKYMDEYALYPEIRVTRCHGISAHFGGNAADVVFDQCRITRVTGSDSNVMPGALTFRDCRFEAAVQNSDKPFYLVGTELGTSFVNCIVYAPKVDNASRPDLADRLGFLVLNKSVSYNHVNTRLGHDILNYCKSRGVKLSPAFIRMLKSHHELEGPEA